MKRHVSALLVIVLVIFSTAAMAQETPWKPKARGQSDKGQWIVEVHKENPEIKQVSFYTKENILMYKEEIKTTKLNVDKEKVVKRLTQLLNTIAIEWESAKAIASNKLVLDSFN